MQRPGVVAALVVLGAFIAGAAVGVAGDRAARADDRGDVRASDARSYWDRIAADWHLTPQQRKVADSLMDAQRKKINALYTPLHPALDSINVRARAIADSTQAQLRLILTPEQQKKLDDLRASMKARDSVRRARREDELAKLR